MLQYFEIIFIIRGALFRVFCACLFPALEEFDRRADLTGYAPQEKHVNGCLTECLLGGCFFYRFDRLKTFQFPRVHFDTGRDYTAWRIYMPFLRRAHGAAAWSNV